MASRIVVAVVIGLGPNDAIADHDHSGAAVAHEASSFSAGAALVAAQFDTMNYGGDYQGVKPKLGWAHGTFGASAAIGFYRLEENGRTLYGIGDAMVSGHATLVANTAASAGVALMMMAPTGRQSEGLGMGHVMAMPSVFGRYHAHPVTLAGSIGFGRALAAAGGHHHGPWPLVDPMNMSELTWSASTEFAVVHAATRAITAGARVSGGVPVGEPGATRVVGGVRIAWSAGTLSTGIEVQAGVVGDPFTVRGVLDTSVTF